MLELRPTCENCRKALPAASTDAMICSYECTFCKDCVDNVLLDVCPNCGGGFVPRPIRPAKAYVDGVSLVHQPAGTKEVMQTIDAKKHQVFAQTIKSIKPEKR